MGGGSLANSRKLRSERGGKVDGWRGQGVLQQEARVAGDGAVLHGTVLGSSLGLSLIGGVFPVTCGIP